MASNIEEANDDGADPTSDIEKQNAGQTGGVNDDDPRRTEKLASASQDGDAGKATE